MFILSPGFSFAQAQVQTGLAYALGVGTLTCASWTASRDFEFATWVEGYWSGVNAMSSAAGSTGIVGQNLGAKNAVEAVRKLCEASPYSILSLEASRAWVNARSAGQAEDNQAAIYAADMAPSVAKLKLIGEAEKCGLRPAKWATQVKIEIVENAVQVAFNLWPDPSKGFTKIGEAQYDALLNQFSAAQQAGEGATPTDCQSVTGPHVFDAIDQLIDWSAGAGEQ